MDAHSRVDQGDLRDTANTATWMTGYLKALEDCDRAPSASQLRKLAEVIESLAVIAKTALRRSRANFTHWQEAHPDRLPELLLATSHATTALEQVVKGMGEYRGSFPEVKKILSADLEQLFVQTLEALDEVRETIALELSESFQKDVDNARAEAGLNGNGKNDVSAR